MEIPQFFKRNLDDDQLNACRCMENYLLTACPGSGKTRTIIYRLAYLTSMYPESLLKNIAITFTNRAANEIRERVTDLEISTESIWTGTIHQFCLDFIIRPYSMFSNRLKKGFSVVDEHYQKQYIEKVCDEYNIIHKYEKISDLLQNATVRKEYDKILEINKQIDFEDILEISKELLESNKLIRNNVSKTIRTIQVDEYQDTSMLQHEILRQLYISNNDIILSFVGDINQSIYEKMGGVSYNISDLSELYDSNFKDLKLKNCYRSGQNLIDYYVNYQVKFEEIVSAKKDEMFSSKIQFNETIHRSILKDEISEIINNYLSQGYKENEICILVPNKWLLVELGNELRRILPKVSFDSPSLTPLPYDPFSPFFLIAKLLFTTPGVKSRYRRRLSREIIKIFTSDYKIDVPEFFDASYLLKIINSTDSRDDGVEMLQVCIINVINSLELNDNNDTIRKSMKNYFMEIIDRKNRNNIDISKENLLMCFQERNGIMLSTYYGVKGEEYKVVIATGLLTGFVPHWNDVFSDDDSGDRMAKLLIYVACSRAKENLYLFSEKGHFTKKGSELRTTGVLVEPF